MRERLARTGFAIAFGWNLWPGACISVQIEKCILFIFDSYSNAIALRHSALVQRHRVHSDLPRARTSSMTQKEPLSQCNVSFKVGEGSTWWYDQLLCIRCYLAKGPLLARLPPVASSTKQGSDHSIPGIRSTWKEITFWSLYCVLGSSDIIKST